MNDEARVKGFLEDPLYALEEVNTFRNDIEEMLEKKARGIEKGLETSMVDGSSFKINELIYFNKRFSLDPDIALLSDSLIIMDFVDNGIDVKERMKAKLVENSENGIYDEERAEIVRKLIDLFPDNLSEYVDEYIASGAHGTYYSGSDRIVMEKIPSKFVSNAADYPPILRRLVDLTVIEDERSINQTIAHEFTHAWLNHNSDKYKHEDIPDAIKEIFAYYVSYIIAGYKFSNDESDLYGRPDLIKWGVQLLVDKTEELKDRGSKNTSLDFARKTHLKIYDEAVSTYKADFTVLLRAVLFKEDKRRLQKFRKIDEEIDTGLSGIKHLVFGDAAGGIREKEVIEDLEQLKGEITWEDPEKMERKILEDIVEAATAGDNPEYGGLLWVNYKITEELEYRKEMMEKYLKAFDKVKSKMEDGDFKQKIEEEEKAMMEIDEKLEDLIESGRLTEAELKHAPAIIADR